MPSAVRAREQQSTVKNNHRGKVTGFFPKTCEALLRVKIWEINIIDFGASKKNPPTSICPRLSVNWNDFFFRISFLLPRYLLSVIIKVWSDFSNPSSHLLHDLCRQTFPRDWLYWLITWWGNLGAAGEEKWTHHTDNVFSSTLFRECEKKEEAGQEFSWWVEKWRLLRRLLPCTTMNLEECNNLPWLDKSWTWFPLKAIGEAWHD